MLDVRKASWKHISQLTVCRDAQGVHLSRSPAEQPLKACFRGYSFSPMHCEKQKFAKYCNVNRAQSVLLSHMSTEEVAHQWRSKQDSASHLPMPRSMALRFAGHSHCCRAAFGPAASKTLLVDTWDAGRHYSLDQAWFLSPRQRDCLKLGHETWLKVSVSLMNPKILLWLQNHWHFGPLCHRNFWAPSLQPSFVQSKTTCAVNMIPWGVLPCPAPLLSSAHSWVPAQQTSCSKHPDFSQTWYFPRSAIPHYQHKQGNTAALLHFLHLGRGKH